jgi:hypothetical protein
VTAPARPAFPRRDTDGRVVNLPELLWTALGYAVVNGLGLLLIDGLLALVRLSSFGSASGWLVLVLPALLYFDDFRAWKAYRIRWLVGPVSALVGIAAGSVLAGVAPRLPPLASGAIGGFVAVAVYAPMWFLGIRRLTGDRPAEPATPSSNHTERRR